MDVVWDNLLLVYEIVTAVLKYLTVLFLALCEYRNITNTADQLRHKGHRFLNAVISQTICKLLCHILHSVYVFEIYQHIIYIILLLGFGIHLLTVQFTGTNLVYCPLFNGHWYNDIRYFVLQ